MSKSKYKVSKGLAHVITTGEPVFVKSLTVLEGGEVTATVIRPIVTQNGIVHSEEPYMLNQLETPFERAKRDIEMEEFVVDLREEAANKRYSLSQETKKAVQAAAKVGSVN